MIDRLLADIKSLMEPYCFYKWHQQESWSRTDDYIESIVQLISEINSGVRTHAFSSQAEEIRYFKEVKPLIETEYVFISTLKRFYENSSPIDLDLPKTYKKQINHLRAFINEEKDFYFYIKKKHTHQDALFFRRLADSGVARTTYSLNADSKACCSHGLLLAKLLAYEKLIDFFNKQLKALKEPITVKETQLLEWKAKKVDAVELVYALYHSGAVNTEKCTLQELAKQFGNLFQMQLSEQLYREFIDIKRRKIEPARFLVKLIEHLRNKVDEEYS